MNEGATSDTDGNHLTCTLESLGESIPLHTGHKVTIAVTWKNTTNAIPVEDIEASDEAAAIVSGTEKKVLLSIHVI